MSQVDNASLTQHALLVAWGQFAHCLGLVSELEAVPLRQKTLVHRPQTKVLEFLVAILAGLPHLKDISRSAHPLDQDEATARAWGQPAWADYSGVSRTLQGLSVDEAERIVQALERVSQPIIDQEVTLAWQSRDEIVLDGDLTGRPVSNSSTTYPGAAYGHMSDAVHLGYQAAMVSMHSPTYGRLWLAVTPHPGDTLSSSQAEALVVAAEAKMGRRPRRRTELMRQRVVALRECGLQLDQQLQRARQAVTQAREDLQAVEQQVQHWQRQVAEYEASYQARQRPERPHSHLAQARHKLAVYQRRQVRREQGLLQAERHAQRMRERFTACVATLQSLQARSTRFEQENAANPAPIRVVLRLDAGFGTSDNVTLLIEMGYEIYLKPHGQWLLPGLKREISQQMAWTRVGGNAEMIAWPHRTVKHCPYPLNLALERFHTGRQLSYSVLLHFGDDPVTQDLQAWFRRYNGRQTIEAGIKEGKQIFQMHHLKVRSEAALYLQEQFAAFAANFVRWAAQWLVTQCSPGPEGWQHLAMSAVKDQVAVAAHTSAWVTWLEQGCLLTFTDHSLYTGSSLEIPGDWAYQLALPFTESCFFAPIRAP
jgi:hypothetical protein